VKRLQREWWDDFDKLSDWLLDQENIEVVNIQEIEGDWIIFFWETT
jgi:hypothetical protein